MKKVIILGAGIYQVPLIKKAKEIGYYTIVCSIPGNYPGFQYADKVYYENTTDKEKILNIAIKENIAGILTTGTDVAVKTIGYVCEKLNLIGISEISANWTTDKYLMKKQFCAQNVRTAEFYKVINITQAHDSAIKLGFPVVFKCVDSSGSRGIVKVKSQNEIDDAYYYSMSHTVQNYILVEKFIDGYEIGLDGYIDRKSNIEIFIPHGKIIYNNGYTKVPIGHTFPFECNDELWQDLFRQAHKAVDSLKLNKSFFNMDILISENKSYIIEIGGRTGATCIPELISCFLKCDFYELMINNAVGKPISIPNKGGRACIGELLTSQRSGKIKKILIPKDELREGEEITLDYNVGDYISEFKVGPDRIGQIVVKSSDIESASKRLKMIKEKILVEVEG